AEGHRPEHRQDVLHAHVAPQAPIEVESGEYPGSDDEQQRQSEGKEPPLLARGRELETQQEGADVRQRDEDNVNSDDDGATVRQPPLEPVQHQEISPIDIARISAWTIDSSTYGACARTPRGDREVGYAITCSTARTTSAERG